MVMAGWDDVPHLDQKTKDTLYAAIPPYQRDARSKGIPQLGSGAIYPVPESDIVVPDFSLPSHWPRGYGFDVGWNRTAGIFGALNRDDDILYLYSEHYMGEAQPAVHAAAMKARGVWIPGRIDPAARGRAQKDGDQLLHDYQQLGMDVLPAVNAVESGLYKVWLRLSTGRLKVFASCQNWLSEFRIYRRDVKGKIVKENDHLLDGTRYLVQECETNDFMITKPIKNNRGQLAVTVVDDVAGY